MTLRIAAISFVYSRGCQHVDRDVLAARLHVILNELEFLDP